MDTKSSCKSKKSKYSQIEMLKCADCEGGEVRTPNGGTINETEKGGRKLRSWDQKGCVLRVLNEKLKRAKGRAVKIPMEMWIPMQGRRGDFLALRMGEY